MKKCHFAALVVLVLPVAKALASPHCPAANSTPESHECIEAEISKAETTLSAYLAAAQAQANSLSSSPPNIEEEQKVWLQYRVRQCGDAYLYWLPGSYRYEAALECALELTRSRTHEVWSTFLLRVGNAPPVLPEPDR
jgi:uncharacterized protein YecT (DUF1311 family)